MVQSAVVPAQLTELLAKEGDALSRFLEWISQIGLELYPAQEEAILELYADKHLILNTPTGSGKSLVATALHFKAMSEGKRSFYTCPIKALVNEKFFALCDIFGAEKVGMMTGDASINKEAPIVCCTAEILANLALRGTSGDISYVIMDEFHYYGDKERGVAWQIPLISLPKTTFLLMSATLGDTSVIEKSLLDLTGKEVAAIRSGARPVPLDYEYRETALHETIADLLERKKYPIYLVNFTQRSAAEQAQNLMSVDVSSKEEKDAIRRELENVNFGTPYAKEFQRFIRHGLGLHHAGLLPRYRLLVETLAQKGLLKVVSGTDTLGMGVNIPIRTVVFTQLCKFDGEKTAVLSVRDFHQISGRAGRKGFDVQGSVVAQAPEHVIENLKLGTKRSTGKKVVMRKPPEKGYVPFDRATFDRLISRPPEPLESRFAVSHGMLLNLLQRRDGGYRALVELIARSHGSEHGKRAARKHAATLFRSLRTAGIIETYLDERHRHTQVRVSPDLQRDFSLNQTLSMYLVDTVTHMDKSSETYALDVLSLVESILENPKVILLAQLSALKTQRMAELKMQGMEFAERIEELDKMEWPKPLAELIYDTFNAFAAKHPWVASENIRPKGIAREMVEKFCSFADFVREYGLERSEGIVLRYLSDVYRTLEQSVPESARTDELADIRERLRFLVRETDSSLLEEWSERAGLLPSRKTVVPVSPAPPPFDERAFAARVRNQLHELTKALAEKRWAEALPLLRKREEDPDPWTADKLAAALAPFFAAHSAMVVNPRARAPINTVLRKEGNLWQVQHKLLDEEGDDDWALEGTTEPVEEGPLFSLRAITE